mgnify:CR=1 FL=1
MLSWIQPGVRRLLGVALGLGFWVAPALAQDSAPALPEGPWLDLRTAEHMFNRFGFGARPAELHAVVGKRSTELFDLWLAASESPEQPTPKHYGYDDYGYDANSREIPGAPINLLPHAEQVARRAAMRLADRRQFRVYVDSVFDDMVAGRQPLRDRLALFWHGFFPTSSKVALRRYELILQYHFLPCKGLAGFDDLLRGMVKDPAMLGYFDNDTNSKSHPNENFARELMELYSLGVGNYTEVDVREAARTLTGYQGESGFFVFDEELHDFGEKTILGQTGEYDAEQLVEILLQQEACANYVSQRLLSWMEGIEPSAQRVERYGSLLRELDYEITPWLRHLAADPEFFRAEAMGTRVQGPIDFLVGASHRLKIEDRSTFLFFAAALCGQQFYGPPTVKGWDEGSAWISASTLTTRGNCVGLLLGHLQEHLRDHRDPEEARAPDEKRIDEMCSTLRARTFRQPDLARSARGALGKQASDEELTEWVAETCLARAPQDSTLEHIRTELLWCRSHFDVQGPLLLSEHGNRILCHLAYTLLRLPIAQLG